MPVVKSREYKNASRLGKKVAYIFTQKIEGTTEYQVQKSQQIQPFMFTLYNGNPDVGTDDIEGISRDMYEQMELIPERKDGTYYAENFINFSGKDFDLSNHHPEYVASVKYTMADIARKWVELRGISETTWVARPHFDTDNPHIHLLFTKNERGQKKRVRISKPAFLKAQNNLNTYQRKHHPILKETYEQEIRPVLRQRAYQEDTRRRMNKAGKPLTDRQHLATNLSSIVPLCDSLNSVAISMKQKGFAVYERGGIPYGVVHNKRHYRFTTLLKGSANEDQITQLFTDARELERARRRLDRAMKHSTRNRKPKRKR